MKPARFLKYHECSFCGKNTSDIVAVNVDGVEKEICLRCFLAWILHDTIKDMLVNGKEEDLRHVVKVLEGINELVEDNPLTQGVRQVIDEWVQKYPKPLYINELTAKWKYKIEVDKVISYLASEGILVRSQLSGIPQNVLSPGDILKKLLQKYPSTKGLFSEVVKAITGLAIVRYLIDPENPKLRSIYATLQAINMCISEGKREPVYEVKGYKCKLCDKTFLSRVELKQHFILEHSFENENIEDYLDSNVEIVKGKKLGEWCKEAYFIEKAGVYGVNNIQAYLRRLLTKGALIPPEGDEIAMEREGEKYVAVDESWIKVREYMRVLEKQRIRNR